MLQLKTINHDTFELLQALSGKTDLNHFTLGGVTNQVVGYAGLIVS